MSAGQALPLRFQIGARTLWSVRRRLVRVPLGLAEVLADTPPALPPLEAGDDGYLLTSLPETFAERMAAQAGLIVHPRQRYTRYLADISGDFDGYLSRLSGSTRQSLKRKQRKLADAEIRTYRTPDEIAEFHRIAREVSAKTYQERLMAAGLPDTPAFQAEMRRLAAADRVRAWILFREGVPIAYLYCPARGDILIYAYLGHDPAHAALSPGTVLQAAALRASCAEGRFRLFDFTEGEGQHKRQFATGGVPCVDLLLLRPTLANRATIAALRGFDAGLAAAKRIAASERMKPIVKAIRRG